MNGVMSNSVLTGKQTAAQETVPLSGKCWIYAAIWLGSISWKSEKFGKVTFTFLPVAFTVMVMS